MLQERKSIQPLSALPTLTASTWYRLRAEFTKLSDNAAQIDVSLTLLDVIRQSEHRKLLPDP